MGVEGDFEPEISEEPIPLLTGDILLLCTDGLWSLLTDEDLLDTLQHLSATDACRELVRRAKERGAPDNITLQVLKMDGATN
jgi:serine/threonine protein phosphatase PrpC